VSAELRSLACFAAAGLVAYLATPVAIRVASRVSFFDVPVGYKGHRQPTPYLGGAAIMAGFLVAALALGASISAYWPLLAGAGVLWAVGTLDDRVNLAVLIRVAVEVGIGVALWALGDGWVVWTNHLANLPITVVWIVVVANAFNLMDNMDGAAATAAAVSAMGAGAMALILGSGVFAPVCFAVAGACAGFLPFNLTRPARIFMGDGGSLPLGFLVAGLTILTVRSSWNYLGPNGVIVGGLLVGLVILDTSLVTYSRARGRRPLFSGGRDHLTHRIMGRLGSSREVAALLAVSQLAVCAVGIAVLRAGLGWVLIAAATAIVSGGVLIWQFERATLVEAPEGVREERETCTARPEPAVQQAERALA
jgi:UDP-GlcNAc:undecaprenyl-phosphate GlcNAc-1-phosphate transferase